jgi:hypothetical protein
LALKNSISAETHQHTLTVHRLSAAAGCAEARQPRHPSIHLQRLLHHQCQPFESHRQNRALAESQQTSRIPCHWQGRNPSWSEMRTRFWCKFHPLAMPSLVSITNSCCAALSGGAYFGPLREPYKPRMAAEANGLQVATIQSSPYSTCFCFTCLLSAPPPTSLHSPSGKFLLQPNQRFAVDRIRSTLPISTGLVI